MSSKTLLLKEINKCVVMCANCHRLTHYGDLIPEQSYICQETMDSLNIIINQLKNKYNINIKKNKPNIYKTKTIYKCKCGAQIHKVSKQCNKCVIKITKIIWPTIQDMKTMVWQIPTNQIAKKLGVSDVAIAKFCKKHNIQKPPRGYWAKQATLSE
jgi:hypothetical protein